MQEVLDQALCAEEADSLAAHLTVCAACRRAFKTLGAVARSLAALPAYSLSEPARVRILAAWAAQRRLKAFRLWVCAAGLALASCVTAGGLWLFERGLNVENGLTLMDLLLDPGRAWSVAQSRFGGLTVLAQQQWSTAAAWLGPYALGLSAGTVLTVGLCTLLISAFLVISLIDRVRPAPQLGRYL